MNDQNYQNARDQVWALLIQQNIRELPVRVSGICRDLGMSVKTLDDAKSDGYSAVVDGRPVIVISTACTVQRQRFTLAHELGHVILGHVDRYRLINREPSPDDNPIEQAANVFASRLLAPACVLWGCNAKTPEQIAELCDISLQAATYRAERMKLLYERGRFLTSPLERQVYEQFSNYIKHHKL